MPMSPYLKNLRKHVGHDLLILTGVSAVIINDAGELLLQRRSDNGRSLVAGVLDPGEQPADAIVREAYEEMGVDIAVDRLVGVALHPVTYPNGDQCHYLNTWFRCHVVGGEARVNDDESLEVGWFGIDALPDVDAFVLLRIQTALKDDAPAWFAPAGETLEALTTLGSG
jgi:8-oxo-dGTP diphosphatase